ncbi:MAG: acyl-CoA dehydrogenase family protein [Candidatus Melainabacteria bacterium]|nr:acyl-CoA dehydrogenase family protein [Candidatus Melainabacteria bacterium]
MTSTMLKTDSLPQHLAKYLTLLTADQKKWLAKAVAFADAISLEETKRSDAENTFRRDLFELACKEGLGALPFPTTYGGSGGDYLSFVLVNEEFARRCVPIMSSLGVHVLCQEPVYRHGTEEQKKKYLKPSSTGQFLAAFGLTEPNAGSDTAAIATTARPQGDVYILNGTKTFITSGASADYFIVMARLLNEDGSKEGSSGITSFIVDKDFPGFQIGQKFEMLGMRGYSTCEIVFSDCRVPKDNILGAPGDGRKVALGSLAKGRVTIAAQATGWAQGALDAALKVVAAGKESKECGQLDYLIGSLVLMVESARVLTYQAARSIDSGESDVTLAAMAKIQATDAAMKVSTEAISLAQERGLDPDLLIERIFRDAKAGQIYEGTNQIQRMLIARSLLK